MTADTNLGGAGTITINGGTLQDNATSFTLASNHTLSIGSSGGGISSTNNGFNQAIILGTANQLTGSGTLTLNNTTGAANSSLVVSASQSGFTGNIVINTGRLELNTNGVTSPLGSGTITIVSGATLGASHHHQFEQRQHHPEYDLFGGDRRQRARSIARGRVERQTLSAARSSSPVTRASMTTLNSASTTNFQWWHLRALHADVRRGSTGSCLA